MKNNPLTDTVSSMLSEFPYYAQLLLCMDRRLTDQVPIAGVSFKHGRVTLHINPNTFNTLTPSQRKGVLLHECCHIIYNHFGRFELNNKTNIATDRVINEIVNKVYYDSIPDVLNVEGIGDVRPITPLNFKSYLKPNTPVLEFQPAEYYLSLLNTEGNGKADEPQEFNFDDHSGMDSEGDGAGSANEVIKQQIRAILNKAKEKTKAMAGNIPSDVLLALDAMNNDTLPWNAVLRKFIDKATDVVLDGSRKKRNRRTGLLAPGIIKEPKLKIGVAMDTSGSVSDDFISAFLGELDKIYGTGITDIRVTFGDTVPNDVVQYKPRTKMNMSGRGGTLFQPFLDKLNDEDVDVIVYFTDGDNYDTIQTKIPVLWCLCPNYSIPKGAKERDCVKMKLG